MVKPLRGGEEGCFFPVRRSFCINIVIMKTMSVPSKNPVNAPFTP